MPARELPRRVNIYEYAKKLRVPIPAHVNFYKFLSPDECKLVIRKKNKYMKSGVNKSWDTVMAEVVLGKENVPQR